MLLQNQAEKIFQPDSAYWESILMARMLDPDSQARVILYDPNGETERLEEYRHLIANLALRDCGNDIQTYAWAGKVFQIVPAFYHVQAAPGRSGRNVGSYLIYLHRDLLRETFSADFTIAVGQAFPARQIYQSYLSAMMTDFYLQYFRKGDRIKRYEEIAPSKWFLHQGLEQRLPELEKRYSPLNRYESERSGYLFSTLRELVRSQFNYQEAAHNLHVHLNTLYYRQEKLSDLLSLDLTDLETKKILYHELFAYDFEQFLHTAKERNRD